jgi:hypothetical protein
VNIFLTITINITLYLPPGLQRAFVPHQAPALSGLALPEITRMALAESEMDGMIFITIVTILY